MDPSEAEILKRISIARGNAEPEPEPTAPPEAVDVSAETPEETEEVAEVETTETIEAVDTEEEAGEEVPEADNSNDEELYVEINGREVTLSEVGEWEKGSLRQADYTRKTQGLADERKTFEAERETFNTERATLQGQMAELEVILSEETLSVDELKELREYEPEEFIKYQEKIAKRKEMLGAAKDVQPVNNVDVEAERSKLWAANPGWLKDGVQTDAFTNDMNVLKTYALSVGYSDQELAGLSHAHHFKTLMDASKWQAMSKKNASIEKKVRKAPVTTKPRAALKSSLVTKIEAAKAKLKKTGNSDDYLKLKELRRQAEE
jgi:hypothetical protein